MTQCYLVKMIYISKSNVFKYLRVFKTLQRLIKTNRTMYQRSVMYYYEKYSKKSNEVNSIVMQTSRFTAIPNNKATITGEPMTLILSFQMQFIIDNVLSIDNCPLLNPTPIPTLSSKYCPGALLGPNIALVLYFSSVSATGYDKFNKVNIVSSFYMTCLIFILDNVKCANNYKSASFGQQSKNPFKSTWPYSDVEVIYILNITYERVANNSQFCHLYITIF